MFVNFVPAVSKSALKSMQAKVRKSDIRNRMDLSLADIARSKIVVSITMHLTA